MVFPHPRRQELVQFLKELREEIISSFQKLEPSHVFVRTPWNYHREGGGEMAVLKGNVFEKAAVNWSGVARGLFSHGGWQRAIFCDGSQFNHPYGQSSHAYRPF